MSVIGVDDEQFGQRLAASVVLRAGAATGPEPQQYVRDNPANYKVPREIKLDELPRSSTGKIVRRVAGVAATRRVAVWPRHRDRAERTGVSLRQCGPYEARRAARMASVTRAGHAR